MNRDNWEKFLATLKGTHEMHKTVEKRYKDSQAHLEMKRKDAGSYLELLGTNTFVDPKDGFKVWVRRYRKVKIIDKRLFMVWLKNNCTPSEVIEFLCPPTNAAALKKFVEKKYDENKNNISFSIDGVEAGTSHIMVKTSYPNEEERV